MEKKSLPHFFLSLYHLRCEKHLLVAQSIGSKISDSEIVKIFFFFFFAISSKVFKDFKVIHNVFILDGATDRLLAQY